MSKTAHTSFKRGAHVWVQMKDGQKFDDHYVDRKGRFVFLRRTGRHVASNIRAMSYYRAL